jgi:hypothetical protein
VGYRGAFTVDGILTAEGFRPTELNPRVGAALGLMVPGFPVSFLHDALVEGLDPCDDPAGLEAELLAIADQRRSASLGFLSDTPFVETLWTELVWRGGAWEPAPADQPGDGRLAVGPGASGGFVNFSWAPEAVPVGESVAERAAALVRYADEVYGTAIGPVRPATAA